MEERFVVCTCEGYLSSSAGSHWQRGLSAHVLDTAYNHRLLQTFRSEDHFGTRVGAPKRRGRRGALTAAREHCRRLNG